MSAVRENCARIFDRIHDAAARSGRAPDSIRLIAVTKTVSAEKIHEAVEAGVRDIGENRVQEALPKLEELQRLPLIWHFIGRLQTNKARKVAERFQWVQSVDRLELAEKLNQVAAAPLSVLIEVKLHEEPGKSGVDEAGLDELVRAFARFDNLQLRGLMAVPPYFDDPEGVRPYFRNLHDLARRFSLPDVSMGMSHDFEIAIEEGATMVRIGTALFGARS